MMTFMTAQHSSEPGSYQTAAPEAKDRARPGLEFAASVWPAVLAGGIGCLVVGLLLLVWPGETLIVAAVLLGIALLAAGLQRLIHGFTARDASGGHRTASVVVGLLAMVVGLYLIRHYHVTIAFMAIFLGVFWVVNGLAELGAGLFGQLESGRGLAVLSGALSLAAGLIVLFWPAPSLTVLVVVMGIWLIIYGLYLIISAFGLRRAGRLAPA
jgi:uncharacterized membrane protein HdeD (DUF308 family)